MATANPASLNGCHCMVRAKPTKAPPPSILKSESANIQQRHGTYNPKASKTLPPKFSVNICYGHTCMYVPTCPNARDKWSQKCLEPPAVLEVKQVWVSDMFICAWSHIMSPVAPGTSENVRCRVCLRRKGTSARLCDSQAVILSPVCGFKSFHWEILE